MLDFDEALERFHKTEPTYGTGLVNQGPMTLQALFALGHPVLSQGWVDVYLPRLRPRRAGAPLTERERGEALGDPERFADWLATFELEIRATSCEGVMERQLAAWMDGAFSATGHALLRTAHALRALAGADTATRRAELAHALAFWAARYRELPRGAASGEAPPRACRNPVLGIDPARAIRALQPLDARAPLPEGVADGAPLLRQHAPFMELDEHRPAPDGIEPALCALSVFAARGYLSATSLRERLAYVQASSLTNALRTLLEHLSPGDRARACGELVRCVAALHLLASPDPRSRPAPEPAAEYDAWEPDAEVRALAESLPELRYRAACTLDAHVIQLCDACLREDAHTSSRWLRWAAAHAALHLSGPQLHF